VCSSAGEGAAALIFDIRFLCEGIEEEEEEAIDWATDSQAATDSVGLWLQEMSIDDEFRWYR
jgi:hypothetical protein